MNRSSKCLDPTVLSPMSDPAARTFSADFKRFFLRGLVVLLPSVLTLWIVVKAYQFVNSAIADPINSGMRAGLIKIAPYWSPAESIEQWWADHWYMNFIGLIVAVVAVYVTGYVLGGFLGRRFYKRIERAFTSLPVFKQVYPYVKQIVDFLLGDEKGYRFNRVVVVEYPRKGIWAVGFATAGTLHAIRNQTGESVTVFIPSSPTPFTGYTIVVPQRDVIELDITVEETIRYIVSGGVLLPEPSEPARETAVSKEIPIKPGESIAAGVVATTAPVHPESGGR